MVLAQFSKIDNQISFFKNYNSNFIFFKSEPNLEPNVASNIGTKTKTRNIDLVPKYENVI